MFESIIRLMRGQGKRTEAIDPLSERAKAPTDFLSKRARELASDYLLGMSEADFRITSAREDKLGFSSKYLTCLNEYLDNMDIEKIVPPEFVPFPFSAEKGHFSVPEAVLADPLNRKESRKLRVPLLKGAVTKKLKILLKDFEAKRADGSGAVANVSEREARHTLVKAFEAVYNEKLRSIYKEFYNSNKHEFEKPSRDFSVFIASLNRKGATQYNDGFVQETQQQKQILLRQLVVETSKNGERTLRYNNYDDREGFRYVDKWRGLLGRTNTQLRSVTEGGENGLT